MAVGQPMVLEVEQSWPNWSPGAHRRWRGRLLASQKLRRTEELMLEWCFWVSSEQMTRARGKHTKCFVEVVHQHNDEDPSHP